MPIMAFQKYRTVLDDFISARDMVKYREEQNGFSIDGLPSLTHLTHSANFGPSPHEGYILAKPLNALDLPGKAKAQARKALVSASPARDHLLNGHASK